MREPPIFVSLLLAVIVTLAIGGIVFPVVGWLYPLEGRSEYDFDRAIRNSVAMSITLVISFVAQKFVWKFLCRKTHRSC